LAVVLVRPGPRSIGFAMMPARRLLETLGRPRSTPLPGLGNRLAAA